MLNNAQPAPMRIIRNMKYSTIQALLWLAFIMLLAFVLPPFANRVLLLFASPILFEVGVPFEEAGNTLSSALS